MRKLLLATHNPGKVKEYRSLLEDLPLEVIDLAAAGVVEEAEESGESFAENAVLKALFYAELTGLWTWADDSGLEVDVLGGEPGIFSARYGGLTGDAARTAYLLQRLQGVPSAARQARFRCTVALALPDGDAFTAQGTVEGRIAEAPWGDNGFGYDPVFLVGDGDLTMAQLDAEEKNRISHRGQAARAARGILAVLLRELDEGAPGNGQR